MKVLLIHHDGTTSFHEHEVPVEQIGSPLLIPHPVDPVDTKYTPDRDYVREPVLYTARVYMWRGNIAKASTTARGFAPSSVPAVACVLALYEEKR